MRAPQWLLTDPSSVDFKGMNNDLVATFKEKILANIPDTPEATEIKKKVTQQFSDMLDELNLQVDKRNQVLATFQESVMPEVVEPNMEGVDPARLEAKANLNSILAAMNMRILQDSYILWSMANADQTGWWQNIGGSEEFASFSEFVQAIVENQMEKDSGSSGASNWRWILGTLLPMLQEHGMPLNKAIAAVNLKSKLRFAISRMRYIDEVQFRDDKEEAYKRIADIIENEVLNPQVTAREIASRAPGSRTAPAPMKIPGAATGMVITSGEGGGLMTIRVTNASQARAIEHSLKGLIDTESSSEAFFPRDELAYLGEAKSMMVNGPRYDPIREPLTPSQISKKRTGKTIKTVIPYLLDELILGGETIYKDKIKSFVGEGWKIKARAVCGYMSDEIHILFTLEEV